MSLRCNRKKEWGRQEAAAAPGTHGAWSWVGRKWDLSVHSFNNNDRALSSALGAGTQPPLLEAHGQVGGNGHRSISCNLGLKKDAAERGDGREGLADG